MTEENKVEVSVDKIKEAVKEALADSEFVQAYLSANKSKQKYILAAVAFLFGIAVGVLL